MENSRPYVAGDYDHVPIPSILKAVRYHKRIETVEWKYMPAVLYVLRLLDSDDVNRFAATLLPPQHYPTSQFLSTLSAQDRITALRACLLVYTVTRGRLVPHDLQLEAGLAAENGKETFVIARTGWGKTLCIAIPLLLRPDRISITISPLKRLQMMQVRIR